MAIEGGSLILSEISKATNVESIRNITDADFKVADNLKIMEDCSSQYDQG